MKPDIKVVARTVPAICIVLGFVSLFGSCTAGLDPGFGVFGFFLIVAGIGLQVLWILYGRRGRR